MFLSAFGAIAIRRFEKDRSMRRIEPVWGFQNKLDTSADMLSKRSNFLSVGKRGDMDRYGTKLADGFEYPARATREQHKK